MQEVWDASHNVPHRSHVEAPWVMPPRRNGEPGKGREELADITCRDWSYGCPGGGGKRYGWQCKGNNGAATWRSQVFDEFACSRYNKVTAGKLYVLHWNSDDSDGPFQLKSIQNSNIPQWKRS